MDNRKSVIKEEKIYHFILKYYPTILLSRILELNYRCTYVRKYTLASLHIILTIDLHLPWEVNPDVCGVFGVMRFLYIFCNFFFSRVSPLRRVGTRPNTSTHSKCHNSSTQRSCWNKQWEIQHLSLGQVLMVRINPLILVVTSVSTLRATRCLHSRSEI